jgi:uncharacterized protein YajQ (UPF0234 family)
MRCGVRPTFSREKGVGKIAVGRDYSECFERHRPRQLSAREKPLLRPSALERRPPPRTQSGEMNMPSFDVVCEANMVEVKNTIEQSNKEISTRFDFKGSDARVEQKERELTMFADDEFKLGQVKDVLLSKMAKRGVDVRFLDYGKIEKIGGDKVKQIVTIKKGVSGDLAKKIVKLVKDSKIKVQASIQGDAVRVTGAKRDDLQSVIALLRKDVTDTPLDFNNFRD